jgi:hypothetical protein
VLGFSVLRSLLRRRHVRRWLRGGMLVICVLQGLTACGPGSTAEPRNGSAFSQVDSAGVLLSINRGAAAHASLGWTVEPEPDFVLGHEGSPAGLFHRIQGMRGNQGRRLAGS